MLPSTALDDGKPLCVPLAAVGWFSARFALDVVPVPVSEMVVGLLVALLVMVTAPVRVPVAVGVKVTFTVQLAPAAMELPQLLVCA